jgi:hypothetical protein
MRHVPLEGAAAALRGRKQHQIHDEKLFYVIDSSIIRRQIACD